MYAMRQDFSCEYSSDDKSSPRKISKPDDGLLSFMTPTKQGKKRHFWGDHVKMKAMRGDKFIASLEGK